MNKAKIIELLLDGAYLVITESHFYHPSFRKGYRKMSSGNISFIAAKRALSGQMILENGIFKVK